MKPLRIAFVLCVAASAQAQQLQPAAIRDAAAKSIALLQQTGNTWFEKQTCTSCHQQDLPMMAVHLARDRGVPVNEDLFLKTVTKAYGFMSSLDRAVQNVYLIDAPMDYGSHLMGAHDAGVPSTLSTAVYARFIANRQQADGSWVSIDERPPQSHSQFTATATAMRAMQLYMPARLQAENRERVGRARRWLEAHEATNTEDRVSQLRGLAWAGADASILKKLSATLIAQQRSDGGWSQLPRLDSDAYATGEVLFALHDAAGIPTSNSSWAKGARFLLSTQLADGSWLVKSRLHEQQIVSPPYFESGFPHRENQMISAMGTTWAIAALLLAVDPVKEKHGVNLAAAGVAPSTKAWMETVLFGSTAELKALLDGGLDPNSRSDDGTTLLMMAAQDSSKVRLLTERGADVNARSKTGFTALMVAANYKGAAESVRQLLNKGAELNPGEPKPMFNASAVSFAAQAGDTDTLDLLVAKGGNVRQKMTILGQAAVRPIDMAVALRDVAMIRYLARKGVNLNEEDPDVPVSLLSSAAMENDLPTAKTLIELGAEVNKVDSMGMTPLLHAASVDFGDTAMVELLLKAGANPQVRSKTQQNAVQLATRYGHLNIARLLEGK
jgi:N-acyl-D-amino-acid deacylase